MFETPSQVEGLEVTTSRCIDEAGPRFLVSQIDQRVTYCDVDDFGWFIDYSVDRANKYSDIVALRTSVSSTSVGAILQWIPLPPIFVDRCISTISPQNSSIPLSYRSNRPLSQRQMRMRQPMRTKDSLKMKTECPTLRPVRYVERLSATSTSNDNTCDLISIDII